MFSRWRQRSPAAVVPSGGTGCRDDEALDGVDGVEKNVSSIHDLPADLLQHVFHHLESGNRKNHFAICAVSRSWRALGQRMFFSRPWEAPHLICHPNQLFTLSPRAPPGSRSGLLKCFVRRESCLPGSAPGRRFALYLGKDPQQMQRARFMMCALPRGRHRTALYLNSRCQGAPCAQLDSNMFSTRYKLALDACLAVMPDGTSGAAEAEGGSGAASATAPMRGGGMLPASSEDVCSWEAPHPRGQQLTTPAAGAGAAPRALFSLQYKARVKGLMQPRRMEVTLPNSAQFQCGQALPHLCRVGAPPSAAAPSPAAAADQRPLRRSLSKPSAVAALELPPCAGAGSAGPSSTSSSPASGATLALPAAGGSGSSEAGGGGAVDEMLSPAGSGRATRLLLRLGRQCGTAGGALLRTEKTVPVEESLQPVCLHNKSPHWNEALRCWCLNFRGRVKLASVKNFQLVRADDPEQRVVLQFGKVDRDAFVLDFNPTAMSAIQAFSIALSTFEGKVML